MSTENNSSKIPEFGTNGAFTFPKNKNDDKSEATNTISNNSGQPLFGIKRKTPDNNVTELNFITRKSNPSDSTPPIKIARDGSSVAGLSTSPPGPLLGGTTWTTSFQGSSSSNSKERTPMATSKIASAIDGSSPPLKVFANYPCSFLSASQAESEPKIITSKLTDSNIMENPFASIKFPLTFGTHPTAYDGTTSARSNYTFNGNDISFSLDDFSFVGSFKSGKASGWGKLKIHKNGAIYEGQFKHGFPHGNGMFTIGEYNVEGRFKRGFFEGLIKTSQENGNIGIRFYTSNGLRGRGPGIIIDRNLKQARELHGEIHTQNVAHIYVTLPNGENILCGHVCSHQWPDMVNIK